MKIKNDEFFKVIDKRKGASEVFIILSGDQHELLSKWMRENLSCISCRDRCLEKEILTEKEIERAEDIIKDIIK